MIALDKKPILPLMREVLDNASNLLCQNYREIVALRATQGDISAIAQHIDQKAEEFILSSLQKAFPHIGFEAEESGITQGRDSEYVWVLDPLDGTANFLRGLPCFGISLALKQQTRNGSEIIAGVVLNPLMNECFWAEKGEGAYCNDQRLQVSSCQNIHEAMLSNGTPWASKGSKNSFLDSVSRVIDSAKSFRRFGVASVDLAYVAAGRYDGYFVTHLSFWDVAAGMILVQEAGGTVTEINGKNQPPQCVSLLATNGHIHHDLLKCILNEE